MAIEAQQILEKLNHMQLDLNYIKKHLVDLDLVLTDDDRESLQLAEEDFRQGKTKRIA